MGDFIIDITKKDFLGFDKLEELRDTFNLTNLVKSETCFINNHKPTIDLLFTNKPLSFQETSTTETRLSDCQKLISTFTRSFVPASNQKFFFFEIIKGLMRRSSWLI